MTTKAQLPLPRLTGSTNAGKGRLFRQQNRQLGAGIITSHMTGGQFHALETLEQSLDEYVEEKKRALAASEILPIVGTFPRECRDALSHLNDAMQRFVFFGTFNERCNGIRMTVEARFTTEAANSMPFDQFLQYILREYHRSNTPLTAGSPTSGTVLFGGTSGDQSSRGRGRGGRGGRGGGTGRADNESRSDQDRPDRQVRFSRAYSDENRSACMYCGSFKHFPHSCDKFKDFISLHTIAFSSLDQALLAAYLDLPKAGAGAGAGAPDSNAEDTSDDEEGQR